jgi:hypothetical protein
MGLQAILRTKNPPSELGGLGVSDLFLVRVLCC